ncbi:hypothetical protein MAPG_00880 [Magnaporthiopsis poae ATCC 64411]|uniref:PBSP domain-containing protein n=1 Tax=Magnaporthiopsis poae (strain ATCC 64411 / 73-15) TaxID=644358 RepID=A0A0C4DM77_MAGP6|nr:hypothetical protein MAPG_00880 [Magnaporthiopsis poae ATCC 64411]
MSIKNSTKASMAIIRNDNLTSPAPQPGQIFMPPTSPADGATPASATGFPVPPPKPSAIVSGEEGGADEPPSAASSASQQQPQQLASFPQPKIRLEVRDVLHEGARRFLSLRLLYGHPDDHTTHCPPTRSVTLVLRDMDGVAYTTGSELDNDHKEIHFSLSYIAGVGGGGGGDDDDDKRGKIAREIDGVIVHELVHAYQWDAEGTCPGGLIEGIADFVRLRCDLGPPHWRKELGGGWDRGYQHTAYFLDYLERRYGDGTIRRMNEKLRKTKYHEKAFWTELLGRPVEQLYEDYVEKSKEDANQITTK